MSLIYEPSEDSYLLREVIEKEIPKLKNKNPDLTILEIGAGSGIQLRKILDLGIKKQNILGTDINPEAINFLSFLGFNVLNSNLFEKINKKFDVIIFNPPYLPEDKLEDKESKTSTTGGKKGSEVINKFLEQAKDYLNKEGIIFLLTSSLTREIDFRTYEKELIASKKLFFEELYVWILRHNNFK